MIFPVNRNDHTNYSFEEVREKSCDFWFDKTFSIKHSFPYANVKYDFPKNLHGAYEVTINAKVWDETHGEYFNGVRVVLCIIQNDEAFFAPSHEDYAIIENFVEMDDYSEAIWHVVFKTKNFNDNRTEYDGLALKIELSPEEIFCGIEGSITNPVTVRIQMRFNRLVKARNVDRMLQDIQNVIEEYNDQPGNKHNQDTYQNLIVENLV